VDQELCRRGWSRSREAVHRKPLYAPPVAAIRVLRVIARMNVGGPALQVTTLTNGLPDDRFETRLLVGDVGADEADWSVLRSTDIDPDRVVRIRGLGREPDPLGDLRALAAIVAEIRRFRPHIVHTHTAKAGALGRTAAWVSRVPATVHTFHGHLLSGYFGPAATRAVTLAERAMATRTTRLVAVGSRVREELLAARIGRSSQYSVVAPGLTMPVAAAPTAARAALGLAPVGPVVAFVARLTPVKRPDRFVAMASLVTDSFPGTQFLVAGDGEGAAAMRDQARGLGLPIVFAGWRGDVETVYSAADVVVITSDNEGMPVSLIEAAHAGRPAVTTDVGSAAEVVDHGVTGFVTGRSATELAAAVGLLLADPGLRTTMGCAGASRAAQMFTPQRLINDTVALYDELAASRGPA